MNSWPVTAINLTYLGILWVLFIATVVRIPRLSAERRRSAGWVLVALFLLAFGDSFHLLSQAYETATGINPLSPFGGLTWIGFGRLASSVTLTIFYLCLLFYCRSKFDLRWRGWLWLPLVSFVVRMVLLAFPQNNWDGGRTLWSIWRNIPFVIQGAGVMGILFQQSPRHSLPLCRQLQALAYAMLVSFATYIGTVVGVFWHPAFGALMLPKTIAYVVVAWLLYAIEFKSSGGIL
ncbi:MAG TPA: hypothetical protein PLJ78_10735 [Anaerolineae bacterium]|nr:hypothetical protein [Anaerolineae bacterium]HQK14402.1 hypothetical protein [Anaerolineae bacterium]